MMVETIYRMLIVAHVCAGFLALIVFWLPVITQNGSRLHRLSGWFFTGAMAMVAFSAMILAVIRLGGWKQSTSEELQFAWFLMLIAWLSVATAWNGLVVLQKSWWAKQPVLTASVTVAIALILTLGSIAVSVYGWQLNNLLLMWFPLLVGVSIGVNQVIDEIKRRTTNAKVWRMRGHIAGMMGCGISTLTAFTVFAFPRLLGWESAPIWLWLLPIVVLNPVIFVAIRRHARP